MSAGHPRKRILICDDEEFLREALQRNLEKLGYEVLAAENGKRAQEALGAQPVDLVISDIRMPEMDGIELTRLIRQSSSVPVILITAFSEILEAKAAYELGANEFLPKPFQRQDLADAIERCLHPVGAAPASGESDYCRIGIEDFISGRQIQFDIFIRLSQAKYVKIAGGGEDLSVDRIRAYKAKNVHFLFLRREDFRKYVGFNLSIARAVQAREGLSREKKNKLLRHTGEILIDTLLRDGPPGEIADGPAQFVQTAVDVLTEDPDIFSLLELLRAHTDHHYVHAVAVSFYSVMIAESLAWTLPANKFKVAMGGLLHDVGEKEIDAALLNRSRGSWSVAEVRAYESHPRRGMEILAGIKAIPEEVIQIVNAHHEDCRAQGFPSRLKKHQIHPMARLVSVADVFCERLLRGPDCAGASSREALQNVQALYADRLDPVFLGALKNLFAFDLRP